MRAVRNPRAALVAAAVAVAVAAAGEAHLGSASAAHLGGLRVSQLYAAELPLARCTDAIDVTAIGDPFDQVTVSGYPPDCVGQPLHLTIVAADATPLAEGTAVIADPDTAVPLSALVDASEASAAHAVIGGLGVTAELR